MKLTSFYTNLCIMCHKRVGQQWKPLILLQEVRADKRAKKKEALLKNDGDIDEVD